MRRRHALAVVPLAALALLAAGCGGGGSSSSDTSPVEEWAGNVCSALTTWTESLGTSLDALKSGGLSQESLQNVVDDAKASTQTLVDDLKDLGKPDTEAGAQAQDTIKQLADELQNDIDEIQSAVNDSSTGTLSTIASVTATISTMGDQLSSAFDELQQLDARGELEDAFKSAGDCAQFTS